MALPAQNNIDVIAYFMVLFGAQHLDIPLQVIVSETPIQLKTIN
jgi:hypothetical protein